MTSIKKGTLLTARLGTYIATARPFWHATEELVTVRAHDERAQNVHGDALRIMPLACFVVAGEAAGE